jgi:hypothetical protein
MANAPQFLFKDNISTLVASTVAPGDTTIAVSTATGSSFPSPSYPTSQLAVTIEDVSGNFEVVYVSGISGDNLTVIRAQEGTIAQNFATGSRVEMRVTSGVLASFLQKHGGDTLTNSTALNGVLALGGGGSIQGGEVTSALRGTPGGTGNQILISADGTTGATASGSMILTKANIAANMPAGYGLVVSLMVLMWYGASNAIPAGYALCDGNGSPATPDLRNHFVVGAGATYAVGSVGNVTGTTNATNPGNPTVNPVTLIASNLPVHKHPFDYYFGNATPIIGDPPFTAPASYFSGGSGTGTKVSYLGSPNAAPNSVAFTPTASMGTHTHTFTATSPPYYGLFYIIKT